MPESCVNIIDSLIERRKSKGMTQKDLAQASNLTQSVIARMESKKAVPQLDTLMKVVNALGCDLAVVSPDNATTNDDITAIQAAGQEYANGQTVSHNAIDWN